MTFSLARGFDLVLSLGLTTLLMASVMDIKVLFLGKNVLIY